VVRLVTLAFDASMFPGTATFTAPSSEASPRGAPNLAGTPGAGTTLPCYVEPVDQTRAGDAHTQPEGQTPWYVFTPTDPGCDVYWRVLWDGRTLTVTGKPAVQDGWNLWRTPCVEVT
jgi:hypothetical protein